MVTAKRNYKATADLNLTTQFLVQYLTVLNTEAGPNFIIESVLPPQLEAYIRAYAIFEVSDAKQAAEERLKHGLSR